jgi:hypothetical protein
MRLLKEIPLPKITENQTIAYGILCAKEVYNNKEWDERADSWLSGKHRNKKAAGAAAYAAYSAAAGAAADVAYSAAAGAAAGAADATAARVNLVKIAEKAIKDF